MAVVVELSAAAAQAVPVTNVGWTNTATVSAIQTIVVTLLGSGGLYGLFRGVALLLKIANQRAAQDDSRDAQVRREMAELNDKQTARIEKLEAEIRDERRRCDEEVAGLRKEHAEEVRELRAQIDAMQRIILQWQISTGQMLSLPPGSAPKAGEAIERLAQIKGVGEQ